MSLALASVTNVCDVHTGSMENLIICEQIVNNVKYKIIHIRVITVPVLSNIINK